MRLVSISYGRLGIDPANPRFFQCGKVGEEADQLGGSLGAQLASSLDGIDLDQALHVDIADAGKASAAPQRSETMHVSRVGDDQLLEQFRHIHLEDEERAKKPDRNGRYSMICAQESADTDE